MDVRPLLKRRGTTASFVVLGILLLCGGSIYLLNDRNHSFAMVRSVITKPPVCGVWSGSVGPAIGSGGLRAITAINEGDVWAVGSWRPLFGLGKHTTLIEHWNGSAWAIDDTVRLTGDRVALNDVAALSSANVWAVGSHDDQTLTLHWDGASWSVAASPNANGSLNVLNGVAIAARDSVWAVGKYEVPNSKDRTLILHWNGAMWSIVPSPNIDPWHNELESVAAVSADDIWAVGYTFTGSGAEWRSLVMHWDGSNWRIVDTPDACVLRDVTAMSQNDVWAVGGCSEASILHWDGTTWNAVSHSGVPALQYSHLTSIAATSPADLWAVGNDRDIDDPSTIVIHWNGARWESIAGPFTSGGYRLQGLAAAPDGMWSVGNVGYSGVARLSTFALRLRSDPCTSLAPGITPQQ